MERAVYFEFKPRIYDRRLNFKVPERHMALLPVFLFVVYFNHTYLKHTYLSHTHFLAGPNKISLLRAWSRLLSSQITLPELDRITCMEDLLKYTDMSIAPLCGKSYFFGSRPVSILLRELALPRKEFLQPVFQHSIGSARHRFFLPVGFLFKLTNIIEPWKE